MKTIIAALTIYAAITTFIYMIIKRAEIKIVLKEKDKENTDDVK